MSLPRGLLAFAGAIFVFQQAPAVFGDFGTWIDLATPFVVLGVAAAALWNTVPAARAVALVGAILYADGHGIHLSANDIRHHELTARRRESRISGTSGSATSSGTSAGSSCSRRSASPTRGAVGPVAASASSLCSSAGRSSPTRSRAATGG